MADAAPRVGDPGVTHQPTGIIHTPIRIPDPGPLAVAPPVAFRAPVLRQQATRVEIPLDVRRLLRSDVTLELRATIDKNGRVMAVTPVSTPSDVGVRSLIRVYSAVIRNWAFEPARRNGQPVPGDLVLRFRVSRML